MRKISIFSVHPSYDYRIERHIKSLLSLGYTVDYYNISNESNVKFNIMHDNLKYFHYHILNKKSLDLFKVYWNIIKCIKKQNYDYYFVQDAILLTLLLFVKDKKKIILDVHEMLNILSKGDRLLIDYFYNKTNDAIVTAYENNFLKYRQKKEFILGNYPLESDFSYESVKKDKKIKILYAGMITEELRQMSKTIDTFHELLKTNKFEVHLIGKIANRSHKEILKEKINELSNRFSDFYYYGPQNHDFVVQKILECDFAMNLISLDKNISISPNKNYEYMIGKTILVTDHTNINYKLPKEIMCICEKNDSPKEVADKIAKIARDTEKLYEMKECSRKYIIDNELIWESYFDDYKKIFK